jgi:hypothetical protein
MKDSFKAVSIIILTVGNSIGTGVSKVILDYKIYKQTEQMKTKIISVNNNNNILNVNKQKK